MAIPTPEPRIARFERMGYGMFIHWGLYAHLGQGEWVQHLRKVPMDEYARIKDTFTAEEFDGRQIAAIAKAAGMQYITLTSRHHDGFSLYDTRGLSDHDAPHSAAGRDLVAELIEGCRAEGISPHFYHTTLDWYQPSFHNDFDAYLDYLHQSIEVLCTSYGAIGGLWFDGNWSKPDADWKEDRLYGIIRQHQPEAMIVNNTGLSALGALGHPEIDSVTFEQGRPAPMNHEGKDKYVAAEMCQTMNRHWGIGGRGLQLHVTSRNHRPPLRLPQSRRQLSPQRRPHCLGSHPRLRVGRPAPRRRVDRHPSRGHLRRQALRHPGQRRGLRAGDRRLRLFVHPPPVAGRG